MQYMYRILYSGIPTREEMLAENITSLSKKDLCEELKGLDIAEKMKLEEPSEKKIDSLKDQRIFSYLGAAAFETIVGSSAGGLTMLINHSYKKALFHGMLGVQGWVFAGSMFTWGMINGFLAAKEKGKNLAHVRIDRLFEKVAFLENELLEETEDHVNTGELIQEIKDKRKRLRPLSNEDEEEIFHPERTESVKVWSPKAESTIKQMNIAKTSFKKIADSYINTDSYLINRYAGCAFYEDHWTFDVEELKPERVSRIISSREYRHDGVYDVTKWEITTELRPTGKIEKTYDYKY